MNNRVLTPMSERSSAPQPTPLIFHALLPTFEWIDRMRLLRYHNYHIGATRAVTGASTLQSCHFQLSSLFKSEQLNPAGRVKQEAPRGAYLSPKSHLRSFFLFFLNCFSKGVSIAVPNLAKVLIRGLVYCYSLHYCGRSLWKLMAQRSRDHCGPAASALS